MPKILCFVDVQLGGMATASVMAKATACCAYGAAGARSANAIAGYDCLMIPGATKAAFDGPIPVSQCGRNLGLASVTVLSIAAMPAAGTGITVCCK